MSMMMTISELNGDRASSLFISIANLIGKSRSWASFQLCIFVLSRHRSKRFDSHGHAVRISNYADLSSLCDETNAKYMTGR